MDDILRAEYLLMTDYKINSFDESQREKDDKLAEWVFKTYSEIEDCEEADEVIAVQMEVQALYDDKIKLIGQLFESETDRVKAELEKTRYFVRMLDACEAKLESFN